MAVNLSPLGGAGAQFFSNNGVPLSGGLLYTYLAGTSTPATTYTSSNGLTALANPIILDAAGRVPTGEIWLSDGLSYKFVLKDATDALIATWDNLSGINSNFIAYTAQEETATATAGQTVFNLSIAFIPGTNNLAVFVNGSNQIVDVNYTETDDNTVTFLTGLNVGDVVKFFTASPVATNAIISANVSYTPAGAGAVTTTVQAKLRQYINVLDYGADPTGVTSSVTAIRNALAYIQTLYTLTDTYQADAKSIVLSFPVGKYLIDQTILTLGNVIFQGDGATIISTNNISTPVFQTAYLNGGVLTSNAALSDNDSITNRLVGLRFENLTFYSISNCLSLRSANEESGIFNCRFNSCDIAWTAKQCFYANYVNNFIRGYKSDNTQFAVVFQRATNRVTIDSLSIASRAYGMSIGETTLANGSASIDIINGSLETLNYGLRFIGNLWNVNIANMYLEEVSTVFYDDGEVKYNFNIANNYSNSTAFYVDLSGLRDSFIGSIRDNSALASVKAVVQLYQGTNGNQAIVELSNFGDASTGTNRYILSAGVMTQGELIKYTSGANSVMLSQNVFKNTLLSQYADQLPVVASGWYGEVTNFVVGVISGIVDNNPTGTSVAVATAFLYSEYSTLTYSITITPNAGSGPGGITPSPVYLRGMIIGDSTTQIGTAGHTATTSLNGSTGTFNISWSGFGSSNTDPNYAWMRNNLFTSEGIIKLIA